ncbi:G3ST4 sulfotransferase, partial [Malurus elegans]|nr:G3ST4 sulfotransferase [Malurus elegans]
DRGRSRISADQRRRLRAWNSLDWALYSHFNRSFWAKAEKFGVARLREEARELRERRRVLAGKCLKGGGPVPPKSIAAAELRPFQPPGGDSILGFALREGLQGEERRRCGRMAMPELPYKDLLERAQFGTNGSDG